MIDAHVHLWQIGHHGQRWPGPELPLLHRDHMPADLWLVIAPTGVDRVLLVQSQEDETDTRWLLSLAIDKRIAGVIGWTDLAAPDAAARIARLRGEGPLVGIRPMVQDRADDWFDNPALDAGLTALVDHSLVLDALVRPRHLTSLRRLARRYPELSIVIDHAAKPMYGAATPDWIDAMRRLAELPQVACKLSGLLTELLDDADAAAVEPCIGTLLAIFGADRLIWGSDWPVLTMRTSYTDWLTQARAAIPDDAHPAVFGGNASRIYRLREQAA